MLLAPDPNITNREVKYLFYFLAYNEDKSDLFYTDLLTPKTMEPLCCSATFIQG